MNETRLRDEICRIGLSLYERRHTIGTAGNISARLDDGWLVTPSDACLGILDPATISKVSFAGKQISGDPMSKTMELHKRIYEASPGTNGILHTHSTYLVALSIAGVADMDEVIPPITPYQVMKVGRVPLIRYARPGDLAVAEQVGRLATSRRAVLLERLGPVVWHESVTHAAFALEEFEETARLWMMLRGISPAPLPEMAIDELRSQFNARW